MTPELTHYAKLLADIKARIQAAQTRAVLVVNAALIRLYCGIGRLLDERQAAEGWGAGVIPRLARDLPNELPEKGFSARNLDRMLAFARAYPEPREFSPQAVARSLGGPSSPQPSEAATLGYQTPSLEKATSWSRSGGGHCADFAQCSRAKPMLTMDC